MEVWADTSSKINYEVKYTNWDHKVIHFEYPLHLIVLTLKGCVSLLLVAFFHTSPRQFYMPYQLTRRRMYGSFPSFSGNMAGIYQLFTESTDLYGVRPTFPHCLSFHTLFYVLKEMRCSATWIYL
ncbi:unnamed protein product [Cylicostephanus goldi]|uniref:Uncharacterized protein n=1 Tax=Cylicostephanus goldi TaxID=71465 RepID=A0A3P6R4I5_CYLGO|nr:unnamed protein product [Cylicostephanus goldi]